MSIVWIDAEGLVLTSPRVSWKVLEKVLAELEVCLNGRVKHQTAAAAMSDCPTLFKLLQKEEKLERREPNATVVLRDRTAATAVIAGAIAKLKAEKKSPLEVLAEAGAKGHCGNPWRCVLAVYFNRILEEAGHGGPGGFKAYLAEDRVILFAGDADQDTKVIPSAGIDPALILPVSYCEVIEQFDLGRLPQFMVAISEGGQDAPDREREVAGPDQGRDPNLHGLPVA